MKTKTKRSRKSSFPVQSTGMTTFNKNTIVQYKGGGYDGCIEEWNYAWIDFDGEFHDIYSSGVFGCNTLTKLQAAYKERPRDFDLYPLDKEGEPERFGRETPLTHLLGVARFLVQFHQTIPCKCDDCGETFDADEMIGVDPKGIGGAESQYRGVVCENCAANRAQAEEDAYEEWKRENGRE